MDELHKKLVAQFGEQRVLTHESLASYLPVTVYAPLFFTITSIKELTEVINLAREKNVPFFILDQDNIVLTQQKDVTGLVIKNNARKFDIVARKGKMQSRQLITDYALLEAESGVPVNQLVRYTIDEGLGGIEELLGSAGTLGRMVKEATFDEISRLPIQSVTILTPTGETVEIELKDLKKDLIVLSVVFKLIGEDSKILWFKARKAAQDRGITEYL